MVDGHERFSQGSSSDDQPQCRVLPLSSILLVSQESAPIMLSS